MKKPRARKPTVVPVRPLSPEQLKRVEGAGGQGVETLASHQVVSPE